MENRWSVRSAWNLLSFMELWSIQRKREKERDMSWKRATKRKAKAMWTVFQTKQQQGEKKTSNKRQPDDQCSLRLPFDSEEGTTNRTTAIKNLERRENRSMQSYTYNRKAFDIMPHKINTPNNKLGKKKRPHSFCHKIVKLDSCHLLNESVLLSLDCCMFVLCCVVCKCCDVCVCVCFGWCTKRLSL